MVELTIERLAYGGDSIARLEDGRTAFVAGGCPGDRVSAEVIEDRDRFVRARTIEVLEASPERVAPPCPYFGVCGGCQWQHVSSTEQHRAKRESVVDALSRIGRLADADSLVAPLIESPDAYGYRNKVELVVATVQGRPRLGYHRAGSEEVVPVDECLLLPSRFRSAPKSIGGALRYAVGEAELGLQRVGLRVARNTKDVEIAIWTDPGPFPRAIAATTLGKSVKATSIVRVLAKGDPKRRKISNVEVLAGKGNWKERLAGLTYTVSAPSFFQVNTPVAERLVATVIDLLQPDGTDRVLDLYSGAGTFTLPLSELAGEVVAVESAGSAVRDLRRNLDENQLWAEVVGGDAAREIATLGHFDLVVVDPPRAGLHQEVIASLASSKPSAIAYVSCDPATLARDTALLAEAGYRLTTAIPADLFPQTYHVETIARFERAS